MKTGLEVNSVSHFYGKFQSLDGVSLQVTPGHVHCLLGASGSGKSTLLRLIAGLENPAAGEIKINDVTFSSQQTYVAPEKRPVGLVFQQYALFPHLSVARNIAYGLGHLQRREQIEIVNKYLKMIELPDSGAAMPHELSGGEQQRVALARALCCEPDVMLLDEPFSNLDPRLRTELRALTLRILKESDVATLLVTHDPREALAVAESMTILLEGKVLQSGSVEQLYFQPNSLQAAKTFGAINCFSAEFITAGSALLSGEIPNQFGRTGQGEILLRPEFICVNASAQEKNAVITNLTNEGSTSLLTLRVKQQHQVFVRVLNPTQLQNGEHVFASFKSTS